MPKINVWLNDAEARALAERAADERRSRGDQASVLLARALQSKASNQPPSAAIFSRPTDTDGGA
jgi:hypothetical protein